MATPGELIKAVAVATGTPEPTVTTHDRNLVTAGLRTKGGRGTSAAKVTPRDAAHLLVAILGSERVQDSVETVRRYSDTLAHSNWMARTHPNEKHMPTYEHMKLPALDVLVASVDHSFIDLLETLITLAMDETFDQNIGPQPLSCEISVAWPRTHARVYLSRFQPHAGAQVGYSRYRWPGARPPKAPAERDGPIRRSAEIYSTPIRHIGALLGNRIEKLPPPKRSAR